MVSFILFHRYAWEFAAVTLGTIAIYIVFTLVVTEWRTVFRRSMNDLDSRANAKAIDALINYETVKYFNNEQYEAERYDRNLAAWEASAIKNQVSLSMLNAGQGIIIASGVTLIMVLAAQRGAAPDDGGRCGAGGHLHHPAVHPAEFPGLHLPRNQAFAG
jgi:ATP-binding cassette subfamily B protein